MNVYSPAGVGILGRARLAMRTFLLTPTQRDQLEQQLRDTSEVGVFRRTLAVLEAANGRPIAQIARLLRASRPRVYQWLEAYRATLDPGSLADHRGGNHPTLWTEELRALLAASLTGAPDHWVTPRWRGPFHCSKSIWPAMAA